MKNEECIELFKEYSDYFSFKASNFDILAKLDPSEYDLEENIQYTTPLLNEIFNFSLIYHGLDIFYLEGLVDDCRVKLYNEVNNISKACSYYLSNLVDEKSMHPTVKRYDYVTNGMAHFELMHELLNCILDQTSAGDDEYISKLFNSIDVHDSSADGLLTNEFIHNIKNYMSKAAFIHYVADYALKRSLRKLLLLSAQNDILAVGYSDNVNYVLRGVKLDSSKEEGFVFCGINNDQTLYLAEIFNILNNLPIFSNRELNKNIKDAKENYHEYKNNQYLYLKSTNIEQQILNK